MGDLVVLKSAEGSLFERPNDLAACRCDDEQLLEAVQWWLLGEPHANVAKLVGVSENEFYRVMRSRGWRKLAGILRDALAAAAHTQITRLVSKALGELEERLEEGDPLYNDKGVLVGYSPVAARNLAAIVGVLVDRQHAIEKRAQAAVSPDEDLKLGDLLRALKAFANTKELAP